MCEVMHTISDVEKESGHMEQDDQEVKSMARKVAMYHGAIPKKIKEATDK